MDSQEKLERLSGLRKLGISLLLAVIGAELVFLAFHGNYDSNEGWYANDVFLLTRGERPYTDFFYHRLPLFLYAFSPFSELLGTGWITLRLLSGCFFLLSMIIVVFLLRKSVHPIILLTGLALAAVNVYGLHIYATVQTYAIVAFLLILAVISAGSSLPQMLSATLVTVLMVATQWMRYPLDYLPIAWGIYIILAYKRQPGILFYSVGLFFLLHLSLTLLFWSESFAYDVFSGMSLNREGELSRETLSKMPASNWFVWAIYKSQWLTDGVRWFLPLLVLGLPLLIHLRLRLLSFLGDRQHLLGFLLVGGNTAMYLAAPEGHVVQMYYVFPLLIFLFCFVTNGFDNVYVKFFISRNKFPESLSA